MILHDILGVMSGLIIFGQIKIHLGEKWAWLFAQEREIGFHPQRENFCDFKCDI
jgi:hypothetical protein